MINKADDKKHLIELAKKEIVEWTKARDNAEKEIKEWQKFIKNLKRGGIKK